MTDFDTVDYWSKRFITEKSFEWLITSEQFITRIVPFLEAGHTLLNLGSGSSDLHVHLRRHGAVVTNVDFAEAAVQHGTVLEEKEFGNVETTFLVADATHLPAFPRKFDLVVDKSTADAISCGDGLLSLMHSVHASMKSDAVWICCSYSSTRFTEISATSTLFEITVLEKLPQPKSSPHSPDVWTWIYLLKPSNRLKYIDGSQSTISIREIRRFPKTTTSVWGRGRIMIKRVCVKITNVLACLSSADHKEYRGKQNRQERKSTSRVGMTQDITAVPIKSDTKRTHSKPRWSGKSRNAFDNGRSKLKQDTRNSRVISHPSSAKHPSVAAHAPRMVGGSPVVAKTRHKSIHVLDPTHQFDGTMARELIQSQNQAEMILPMFVLAKRVGAALVRNIHRDIQTLRRLEGRTVLSTKHEGMKWWNKQMGAPYECVAPEVWIAALSMATNDLQMRGFIVHKFELHADVAVLKILWSLDVRGDGR